MSTRRKKRHPVSSPLNVYELPALTTNLLALNSERLALSVIKTMRGHKGPHMGWRLLQEECAELIAVINQYERGRKTGGDVALEIADVFMMLGEACFLLADEMHEHGAAPTVPYEVVREAIAKKLKRFEGRLKRGKIR